MSDTPGRPAVLVTRAEPGCGETVSRLEAMGYRAIASPALDLQPVDPPPPLPVEDLAGVIFTSANGVRAFTGRSAERDLKAWCVGPATIEAAAAAGFADRVSADGTGDDLADLIARTADPGKGPLLHVANAAAGGRLVERLRREGFTAHFAGLYSPLPASTLTCEASAALRSGAVDAVLFHSARGAAAFAALAEGLDLSTLVAIAVSEKALSPVERLGWRTTATADRPNETALLARLVQALASV